MEYFQLENYHSPRRRLRVADLEAGRLSSAHGDPVTTARPSGLIKSSDFFGAKTEQIFCGLPFWYCTAV
jgi:hypothetical protein